MNHKPSPDNCPYCGTPMCELPCHQPAPSKDWEKEFDRKFTVQDSINPHWKNEWSVREVKFFISKTLASQKSQWIEKLKNGIDLPTKIFHEVWCDSLDEKHREYLNGRCNCNQSDLFYLVREIKEILKDEK